MKNLILFIFLFSFSMLMSQNKFDYSSEWKKIENLENQGLSKSLLPSVENIYQRAKKENNTNQLIRALFYKSKISMTISDNEDIEVEVIRNFEKEIAEAKGVNKSFFQSILAELYAKYYSANGWKITQRTETQGKTTDDFRFWSSKVFQNEIAELYVNSLKDEKSLKSESIENWSYVLNKVSKTEDLRPTLYDFLAHRTIEYFQNRNSHFESYDPEYEEFKKNTISDIYLNLIDFHTSSRNSKAVAYNELEFLRFQRAFLSDFDFEEKLNQLYSRFPNNSYTPYILIEIALFQEYKYNLIDEKDFQKRKDQVNKILEYLNQIQKDFPNSELVQQAKSKIETIKSGNFQIQIEKYVSPDLNIPIIISHTNLNTLYFRVLRYDEKTQKSITDYHNAKETNKQKALTAIFNASLMVEEFQINLKEFDDYQSHSTLAKINPLKPGKYAIFASNNSNFSMDSNFILNYEYLNVSNYAISFENYKILLSDRESGKMIPNKNVGVFEFKNNQENKIETLKTNEFGVAEIKSTAAFNRNVSFKVEGDLVEFSSSFYSNRYPEKEFETGVISKILTDRAIYRPGQTVYFKVIHYKINKDKSQEVLKNYKTNVGLYDANEKLIKNLALFTNDFGSVSGEFILPSGGLTGEFSIRDTNSSPYYFSVEEYKRPRFEVKFDNVKDVFKLNQEITSKGQAISYSGANITNAKVVYRVYRQAIYPYRPWWMAQRFPVFEPEEELIQGETETDADGNFTINFIAKPAPEISMRKNSKDNFPRTYTYRVMADVIDVNGETHSSEQSINVGDLRFTLDLLTKDKIEISEFDSLEIRTQNLNGEFVQAKGKITLTKINPPKRILRDSPLKNSDYQIYSKEEFIKIFPHEPYGDELLKENWEKETPILEQNFDTGKSKTLKIPSKKWQEGYYILKGFIVDENDTIPSEKLIYLYKNDKQKPIDHELFSVQLDKEKYKPGDIAVVTFTSAAADSEVIIQLESNGKIVDSQKLPLNNSTNSYKIPIKEEHRGNIFVHYYFGKFNTAKSGNIILKVPYEDNSLKITAGTLRDKLKPGGKEIWELTVTGKNKEKFVAEMLATMYDASLDQFRSNSIEFSSLIQSRYPTISGWKTFQSFGIKSFNLLFKNSSEYYPTDNLLSFSNLNWYGFEFGYKNRMTYALRGKAAGVAVQNSAASEESMIEYEDAQDVILSSANIDLSSVKEKSENLNQIVARKALQVTAFFFPHLKTDKKGNIKIQFTVPESLTSWKFMALAHTPEVNTGYFTTTVQTQKELMVTPNPPRFLREGDEITFSSKITNLSEKDLKGQVKLMLFDAFNMQPLDSEFENKNAVQNFTVDKGKDTQASWRLRIPNSHQAIVYRIAASTEEFSDGEESALPILTNRMMVTETMPISVREGQIKNFSFDKLKNSKSASLENFKLTFEMTSNPIWYALFALPYLRENQIESSDNVFGRLYGNLISQHLVNSNPKIKAVFDNWNQKGELKSKLEQNQELKQLLLEETPWVRDAESEEEQMKRIALLFDLNKMTQELNSAFQKLESNQSSNGGFPWFDGGDDNRFISTYIVSGFGHLQKMGIDLQGNFGINTQSILSKTIQYLDLEMEKEYDVYLKNNKLKPSNHSGTYYLYARSYFLKEYPLSKKGNQIKSYFLEELNKEKFENSLHNQAILSLIFNRYGEKQKAESILKSIKDNAVQSDEMGMYWKSNQPGWYWYQAPVETQALLIEAFDEVLNDVKSVESMKVWLLKNKQTNSWKTSKSTSEAVFALLSTGKVWIDSEKGIEVKIGNENLPIQKLEKDSQKGSGYFKTSWNKNEINSEMADVKVEKTSPGVTWGAMYWQYFEDLDKITNAETSVRFKKELFLKKNSTKGPVLTKITENQPIQIGDVVTIRLEIQTDRDMEFVHLKDMRASGFEPISVLSGYKWQGGFGYYESTRDAATHFFIDRLRKGTYVFEYDLRANNSGNFSNGITTLQNMYAPELSAHSEGIRVEIK